MNNEKDYIEYLSSLDDENLEKETKKIYDDCVYYNNCGKCIHKFDVCEKCFCKLNAIFFLKGEKNNEKMY